MAGKHKFIKKAIKHPGALKAQAEHAGESTREFAAEHAHDSGKTGQRARLAETLMAMPHGRAAKRYGAKTVRR